MRALPALSGRVVIAALERAGFEVIRTKGSYRFLRHRDGPASVGRMQSAIIASPERRRLLANTRQVIRGVNDCRRLTALSVVRTRLEGIAISRAAAHKRRIASALRLLEEFRASFEAPLREAPQDEALLNAINNTPSC
jgi:hypothetical protein